MRRFLENLAHVKVLDPACGSGNFLYVTLQKLKDLEKAAIIYAQERLGASFLPLVGPWQLYGIEISPYAHELAQMTVWIGYLQWVRNNGFGVTEDPVLRPMDNFQCKDAILDLTDPENPREPEWPKVDFIVGNPPFLGGEEAASRAWRRVRGPPFTLWRDRVPLRPIFAATGLRRPAPRSSWRCSAPACWRPKASWRRESRSPERIKETAAIFSSPSQRPALDSRWR